MKILLIIDHFGPGGAQRQMVELACGLKQRGHAVEMFVYFPQYDFFRARLDEHHIVVHERPSAAGGSIGVVRTLGSLMRGGEFDVAASFLSTPGVYAELARVAAPGTRLIVSERTSFHDDKSAIGSLLRRLLHLLSDRVVANSETQAAWLKRKPWLKHKVSCIYNGVDLGAFRPNDSIPNTGAALRLLGIGRVGPEKNLLNLITALARFYDEFGFVPEVGWAGNRDLSHSGRLYSERIDELLGRLPSVGQRWHWLGLQTDVPGLLLQYHALIHPSLYEGLPNSVCEAMAAGKPVLASNVCDHPMLVADGLRGYLFEPDDPASIAAAISKLANLDAGTWRNFARNAREYASINLSVGRMVESYETLFKSLRAGGVRR